MDSTISLLSKSKIFQPLTIFCDCTAQFVSDLVRTQNRWFSHAQAHISVAGVDQRVPAPAVQHTAPIQPKHEPLDHKDWQQGPAQVAPPPVTTQHPLDYIQEQLQQANLQAASHSTVSANQMMSSGAAHHSQPIHPLGIKQEAYPGDSERDFIASPTKRDSRYSPGNVTIFVLNHLSRLVEKPTMWFPNRSDTNQPVQAQKRAKSLKFRI